MIPGQGKKTKLGGPILTVSWMARKARTFFSLGGKLPLLRQDHLYITSQ